MHGMDNRAFGKTLKRLREKEGLSQEELAFQAELHRTYISQIERGIKSPSLRTIQQLATALGIRASALIRRAEGHPD